MAEDERLHSLRNLMVLDGAAAPLFDSIARLASEACGVPIAFTSLVDADRQRFDASADPRGAAAAFVVGTPGIRFDPAQSTMLAALGRIACQAFDMRRDIITRSLAVRTDFESRLSESESMHRALVEMQSDFVSLAEPDGSLLYVNPAHARHSGLAVDDLAGRNLLDLFTASDRQAVRERLACVVATGQASESEYRTIRADGSERWVAWKNSLYTDPSGRLRLHSVGRDITERHRVEDQSRASRRLLEGPGRLAGVGGWEIDIASGAVLWSAQTRRIYEVPQDFRPTLESAIGFYAPEARPVIAAAAQSAIDHGIPWDLELPMITASGRHIWARSRGEVECEGAKAVRVIGSISNITERKLLGARLEQSERFIRQITDHLPIRIAYLDRELRYRFANQAHCQRFERSRKEIIGRTREELTGRPTGERDLAKMRRALDGHAQRFETEEMHLGAVRLMEIQLIPDNGPDGVVRGFYSTGSDITERSVAERRLRDLTAILENSPDFVVKTDADGRVVYLNPAARRFCGLASTVLPRGRSVGELFKFEDKSLFRDEILPAVKARGAWSGETGVRDSDGQVIPVSHMIIGHEGPDGSVEGYSSVMRNISRVVADRRELQAQTSALLAVLEAIPAIVVVVAGNGLVRMVNSACERWTGVDRGQAIGGPLAEALGPIDADGARPWSQRALAGETGSYAKAVDSPGGVRHVAGSYSPLHIEGGATEGFILVAQDVTEHKREEVRLLQLSRRDPLTGLLNRAGFQAEVERLTAGGQGHRLALLCIDLDHFKPVNDCHGHPVGDAVLRDFAQRMERLVRPTDLVARLGGDEFAILLSGVGNDGVARGVADKVIAAALVPFHVGRACLRIGASVGVALGSDPNEGWEALFGRADAMLYRAKGLGRSQQACESAFT